MNNIEVEEAAEKSNGLLYKDIYSSGGIFDLFSDPHRCVALLQGLRNHQAITESCEKEQTFERE